VYRNNVCHMALMDAYDITNKAILCDPSNDIKAVNCFKSNTYDRLKVIPDHLWEDVDRSHYRTRCTLNGMTRDGSHWTPLLSDHSSIESRSPDPQPTATLDGYGSPCTGSRTPSAPNQQPQHTPPVVLQSVSVEISTMDDLMNFAERVIQHALYWKPYFDAHFLKVQIC